MHRLKIFSCGAGSLCIVLEWRDVLNDFNLCNGFGGAVARLRRQKVPLTEIGGFRKSSKPCGTSWAWKTRPAALFRVRSALKRPSRLLESQITWTCARFVQWGIHSWWNGIEVQDLGSVQDNGPNRTSIRLQRIDAATCEPIGKRAFLFDLFLQTEFCLVICWMKDQVG